MRPKPWFAQAIRQTVQLRMYSPSVTSVEASGSGVGGGVSGDVSCNSDNSEATRRFPDAFISLHVRYGKK